MRVILSLLASTFILISCEKPKEISGNGYFSGFVNGVEINSDHADQKYKVSLTYYINDLCPTNKGDLIFSLSKTADSVLYTGFYIDGVRELKGKRYLSFNSVPPLLGIDCKKIPQSRQWIFVDDKNITNEALWYNYIPDKQNYLKIDEVGEDYVGGHFKVKFIRKEFIEKGIQSFSKEVLPDSLSIECKRFYAVIRE